MGVIRIKKQAVSVKGLGTPGHPTYKHKPQISKIRYEPSKQYPKNAQTIEVVKGA